MAKTNSKQTSPKITKLAAKVLQDPNSSKKDKSLAGSALSQAKPSKKGK